MKRRRTTKRTKRPAVAATRLEWIGGSVSPPFFISDPDDPYRVEMVLWLEMPSGLIVGQDIIDRRQRPGDVARVLQTALGKPLAGPCRQPDAIRVGDTSLAREVRSVTGDSIPVRVAPTPELDELLQLMIESMPDPNVDEQARAPRRETDEVHDLDARLLHQLGSFAERRFGNEWLRFERDFGDEPEAIQLMAPWSVYGYSVRGATVLEWYLEEHGGMLTGEERTWLAAQQAAWLSVWEATEVEAGVGMTLHDLLSGEVRRVREISGSQVAVVRDTILTRVIDYEGVSFLGGTHPRKLTPLDAEDVLRRARGRLRRKRTVSVEKLRDAAIGRYLIRRWEEAVARLDTRRARSLELINTDGDPILLTTDHFEIPPESRSSVESRIAALDEVEPRDDGENSIVYVFFQPGRARQTNEKRTLIGTVSLSETKLWLETNSLRRADALRKRIEAACGRKIRHLAREHMDPQSSRASRAEHEPDGGLPPEDAQAIAVEYKRRHYAQWADHALPALGGKTPREAVRTASGRAAVDVLLKEMENNEQRLDDGTAFDFGEVRRSLRLD